MDKGEIKSAVTHHGVLVSSSQKVKLNKKTAFLPALLTGQERPQPWACREHPSPAATNWRISGPLDTVPQMRPRSNSSPTCEAAHAAHRLYRCAQCGAAGVLSGVGLPRLGAPGDHPVPSFSFHKHTPC